MNPAISAGYVRAKPLARLRKIGSGKYETKYLHPDGQYHDAPMPKGSPIRGITYYERLIEYEARLDG